MRMKIFIRLITEIKFYYNEESKILFCYLNVRHFVSPTMRFVIFDLFNLEKVPKYAEFNEVLQIAFRFSKFSGILT